MTSAHHKLAETPKGAPLYSTPVKNAAGEEVFVGDPKATRALLALMNSEAVLGGAACHWGGPSAFAEVMSSVHSIMFANSDKHWYDSYNFVNDAGHAENGIYALRANLGFDGMSIEDLKDFRSMTSKLTGHGEAHLNPEGVLLSNGPLGSSVAQAQGLALADKLSENDRATLLVLSDGAAMEGEAREGLASIPGMASKGNLNPFVLILSDNNTKLSGRIDDDAFSMVPSFDALEAQGWNVIKVEQGNDLQLVYTNLEDAIAKAKANPAKPVCLWLKTVKGIGVEKTAQSASGGHGFPGDAVAGIKAFVGEIYTDSEIPTEISTWMDSVEAKAAAKANKPKGEAPAVVSEKVQMGLSRAAIKLAKENVPVISVSSDLPGSTGIAGFRKEFPEKSFDVGVAESNMVSVAAGLSKHGYIPVVDTFAQFGVTKGALPITMASLSQSPVIALFSHTGFQDAADGASHQALGYFSSLAYIPDVVTIACSCSADAEAYLYEGAKRIEAAKAKGEAGESVVIFLGRENFPAYHVEGQSYEWGKAQVLREGTDGVIVAAGYMASEALKAADELATQGKSVSVVVNAFVNQPDVATISAQLAKNGGKLVTLEDHQLIGGMGQQLIGALANEGVDFKVKSLAVKGEFGQSAYSALELYSKHGIDSKACVDAINAL
jgi:transketolase